MTYSWGYPEEQLLLRSHSALSGPQSYCRYHYFYLLSQQISFVQPIDSLRIRNLTFFCAEAQVRNSDFTMPIHPTITLYYQVLTVSFSLVIDYFDAPANDAIASTKIAEDFSKARSKDLVLGTMLQTLRSFMNQMVRYLFQPFASLSISLLVSKVRHHFRSIYGSDSYVLKTQICYYHSALLHHSRHYSATRSVHSYSRHLLDYSCSKGCSLIAWMSCSHETYLPSKLI